MADNESSGEQVLVATVPTPDMRTAEGLTGEKTATSFGTYANGGDGNGDESMMNMNGPGGGGPDLLNDSNCGCDMTGSASMQDTSGPQLGQPAHGPGDWGREGGHGTENSMISYQDSAYNSGIR